MEGHLPPAAQEKIEEIQDLQREANAVVDRKEQAERDIEDSRAALDALDAADEDATVYRTVGAVRVESDHDTVREALTAKVEQLEARIETLDEEETELRAEFQRRKDDVKHLLGGAGGDPSSPGTTE